MLSKQLWDIVQEEDEWKKKQALVIANQKHEQVKVTTVACAEALGSKYFKGLKATIGEADTDVLS